MSFLLSQSSIRVKYTRFRTPLTKQPSGANHTVRALSAHSPSHDSNAIDKTSTKAQCRNVPATHSSTFSHLFVSQLFAFGATPRIDGTAAAVIAVPPSIPLALALRFRSLVYAERSCRNNVTEYLCRRSRSILERIHTHTHGFKHNFCSRYLPGPVSASVPCVTHINGNLSNESQLNCLPKNYHVQIKFKSCINFFSVRNRLREHREK